MRRELPRLATPILAAAITGCSALAGPPLATTRLQPVPEAAPLAWEAGHPERKPWSQALRTAFAADLRNFDTAMAGSEFCLPYATLSDPQKVEVLATLAVGMARYESGYDPAQHYHEPMGYDSIGLFQLSYEDHFAWCIMDSATKSLESPITNIQCAVPEMARLAAQDGTIAAGTTSSDARGLARYWSVLRAGPAHHRADIIFLTRSLPVCRA